MMAVRKGLRLWLRWLLKPPAASGTVHGRVVKERVAKVFVELDDTVADHDGGRGSGRGRPRV
jgi:hypothetical protein